MNRYKILLVEDDDIVAIDTRRRLETLGHEVAAVVPDGPGALAAVREVAPDVVLMDIGLPGDMDGIEAAAQLKALWDAPVVYLTAHEDED
ncbi:MAG: response regulator, partial [Deltaproteobacteria bacterium]|nr:response regulator [Deltaproteobacteria bacterium]